MPDILSLFAETLTGENYQPDTVATYLGHLRRFYTWCEESYGKIPEKLYRTNVQDFRSYLMNIRRLKPESVNSYMSALLQYNAVRIEMNLQKEVAVLKGDLIPIQPELYSPCKISVTDVEQLRQSILVGAKTTNPFLRARDYALVTILAYAGLRISEAIRLRVDDIDLSLRQLIVRDGKGGKARYVFINDKIIHALAEWYKMRKTTPGATMQNSPFIFPSRQGQHMSRQRANQVLGYYTDKISPHDLRHFFVSRCQEVGYSDIKTAQQAGHKDPRTTKRYTHPSRKEMLDKANRL